MGNIKPENWWKNTRLNYLTFHNSQGHYLAFGSIGNLNICLSIRSDWVVFGLKRRSSIVVKVQELAWQFPADYYDVKNSKLLDLTGIHGCVTGGPGSGRAAHSTRLVERYPGWLHLSMGGILRETITSEGSASDRWSTVNSLVQRGEMAPQVRASPWLQQY